MALAEEFPKLELPSQVGREEVYPEIVLGALFFDGEDQIFSTPGEALALFLVPEHCHHIVIKFLFF